MDGMLQKKVPLVVRKSSETHLIFEKKTTIWRKSISHQNFLSKGARNFKIKFKYLNKCEKLKCPKTTAESTIFKVSKQSKTLCFKFTLLGPFSPHFTASKNLNFKLKVFENKVIKKLLLKSSRPTESLIQFHTKRINQSTGWVSQTKIYNNYKKIRDKKICAKIREYPKQQRPVVFL